MSIGSIPVSNESRVTEGSWLCSEMWFFDDKPVDICLPYGTVNEVVWNRGIQLGFLFSEHNVL